MQDASKQAESDDLAGQLSLQEQEAIKRVHVTKHSMRPKSTHLQCSSKALEFISWMKEKGYMDEQVTEAKMVLFISEIQSRTVRKPGRRKKFAILSSPAQTSPYEDRKVGHATVAAYVNAFMDLWRLQDSLQPNCQAPTRPASVKELLKQKKVLSVQESEAAFDDAGAGTMVDSVLTEDTVQKIIEHMFNEHTENGLKHRANVLPSLGFSSRGDNIRMLRLPNIGLISFNDEGVCRAKLLRAVWRKSKRNQFGNAEETTLMRHREARRCPFGALAH